MPCCTFRILWRRSARTMPDCLTSCRPWSSVSAHNWGRENRSDICRARGSCLACVFRRGVLLGIRAGGAHMVRCPPRVLEAFVEFGQFALRTADFTFCLLRVRHCVFYLPIILAT